MTCSQSIYDEEILDRTMNSILCYYTNSTRQLQQIRLQFNSKLLLDRLVFPGEKFLFEASPDEFLEIYTYTTSGQLLQTIGCLSLKVLQR